MSVFIPDQSSNARGVPEGTPKKMYLLSRCFPPFFGFLLTAAFPEANVGNFSPTARG
jgi:hypothetical protein